MIINPPLNVIFNIIHILNIFHAKIQEKKIAKGTIGFNNSTPQNPKIMCSWFCQLKQILNCLGPIHFLLFLLTATTIADTTYGSCNCHVLPMIEKKPSKKPPSPRTLNQGYSSLPEPHHPKTCSVLHSSATCSETCSQLDET